MGISQVLFDAIQQIEAELKTSGEFGKQLRKEIAALVKRMKDLQQKLDSELTEIDSNDAE